MGSADLDSVARSMTLASGYVWSIPILFDVDAHDLDALDVSVGDAVLLTHQGEPLATLEIREIYDYDRKFLAHQVYGTTDAAHPGVQRTNAYRDRFVSGPVTLVNPPSINPPFDRFWQTPRQIRETLAEVGWSRVVAHQSRNVPHSGHEWLMKGAYLAAEADGILVSAVIGEKKPGDYIDEAIVLTHQKLRDAGFFKETSTTPRPCSGTCATRDLGRRCSTPSSARIWAALTTCSGGTTRASAATMTPTPPTTSSTNFRPGHQVRPDLGVVVLPNLRRSGLRGTLRSSRPEARTFRHLHPQHHPGRYRTGAPDPASGNPGSGAPVLRRIRVRFSLRGRRVPAKPHSGDDHAQRPVRPLHLYLYP